VDAERRIGRVVLVAAAGGTLTTSDGHPMTGQCKATETMGATA
jgi:hypothetical protein